VGIVARGTLNKKIWMTSKSTLSERDICSKFITPALRSAGWDELTQIREEYPISKGRIIVRGRLVSRGAPRRADYVLSVKPNIPVAVIEAKDNTHSIGDGLQQALGYAEALGLPFAFSSNGDGFVLHDRTGATPPPETTLSLELCDGRISFTLHGKRFRKDGLPGKRSNMLFLDIEAHDPGN
jgi:type I restriction enzyme R subunit